MFRLILMFLTCVLVALDLAQARITGVLRGAGVRRRESTALFEAMWGLGVVGALCLVAYFVHLVLSAIAGTGEFADGGFLAWEWDGAIGALAIAVSIAAQVAYFPQRHPPHVHKRRSKRRRKR